jgi:hypothetical protein
MVQDVAENCTIIMPISMAVVSMANSNEAPHFTMHEVSINGLMAKLLSREKGLLNQSQTI